LGLYKKGRWQEQSSVIGVACVEDKRDMQGCGDSNKRENEKA